MRERIIPDDTERETMSGILSDWAEETTQTGAGGGRARDEKRWDKDGLNHILSLNRQRERDRGGRETYKRCGRRAKGERQEKRI